MTFTYGVKKRENDFINNREAMLNINTTYFKTDV